MMRSPSRILAESEVMLESFHDCHVYGLHWRRDKFVFSMHAQYILEWIGSSGDSAGFSFLISEARIIFRDVDELRIVMDWSNAMLDSQIDVVKRPRSRTAPSGILQYYYELEFSEPEATITLWSTGFEIVLLGDPVMSKVTSIPMSDEV